ncbi:MAG: hypothetical protein ACO3ND_05205 [Opitutales bacterium]
MTDEVRRAAELGWTELMKGGGFRVSRGLMTDPVSGGFRRDLSDDIALSERITPEIHARWRNLVRDGDPLAGLDIRRPGGPAPLLVGLNWSVGVFNSRADGRHRIRFHATGRMWNDCPLPVYSAPRGRMLVIELRGAPVLTIRNLDSGATIEADLEELPELDLGFLEQGRRERRLWFITGVHDGAIPPMTSPGLLAGETYAFTAPHPVGQPQGLARILSPVTWRMDRRPHSAGWVRPSPEDMAPADRILITLRFDGPVSFVVRKYVGEPPKSLALDEYAGEVVQVFDGLRFPTLEIETTAEEYSRPDSAGYEIAERRFCLGAQLRCDSPEGVMSWVQGRRAGKSGAADWLVRHPLDFGRPEDERTDVVQGLLWDHEPDAHGSPLSFGRAISFERPWPPLLAVPSLRHLGDRTWGRAMDSCVFLPREGRPSHPHLRPWPKGVAGVADWYIDGAFNVNSTRPDGWSGLLWTSAAEPSTEAEAIIPTRPSAVAIPAEGSRDRRWLGEHELRAAPSAVLKDAQLNQCRRMLTRSQVDQLAECIVREVRARGPFSSLSEFVGSGCLSAAIDSAGLNTCIPPEQVDLPLRLDAEHLLELLAPRLASRADTFEAIVTLGGSSVECRLIIQRVPNSEGLPSHLGRRLKIISVRHHNSGRLPPA